MARVTMIMITIIILVRKVFIVKREVNNDISLALDSPTAPLTCPAKRAEPIDASQHTFPNNNPVVTLDASEAFSGLTEREQLYAHYLSRASFYGSLIVLVQTSPEAVHIFRLLHRINTAQV